MRIGHGYDVHKLVPNRKLILGGVEIPHTVGLLGHSDADVLTHALMDALLGAAALGDIGHLFPDSDPAYEIPGVATEWNRDTHMPKWNSKIVAYMAGMGEIGPAGSFHTEHGFAGSLGSTMTDGFYADEVPEMTMEEIEAEVKKIKAMYRFEPSVDVACSEEMMSICPGQAIDANGINREKCLAYCESQNPRIPDPGLCGMCFRFK